MANPYVTGPCHLYLAAPVPPATSSGVVSLAATLLNYPSASDFYYLGTCETSPKIFVNPKYKALFANIGGDEVPFDWAYMGSDAQIVGVLTRWNEYVFKKIATRPRADSGTLGLETCNDIGTLMLAEAKAFPLWLHFPYYSKPFGSVRYMLAGYHFLACFMAGPDVADVGTKAMKRAFVIQASRVYNPANGSWTLCDSTMTNIPALPPVGSTGLVIAG